MPATNRPHDGHRARMREKFLRHGHTVFDSYELVEMLLYYHIPYKDTNPIAHALLREFGDLNTLFNATKEEIAQRSGVSENTAAFLAFAAEAGETGFCFEDKNAPFSEYEKTGQFLSEEFRGHDELHTVALFLDNKMNLIGIRTVLTEEFSDCPQCVNDIAASALRLGAAAVILAHNHPDGPLYATPGDRENTFAVKEALYNAGVMLMEHYILCKNEYCGILRMSSVMAVHQEIPPPEFDLWDDAQAYISYLLCPVCKNEAECDTICNDLLHAFGGVRRALQADARELAALPNVGQKIAVFIKLIMAITSRRITDALVPGVAYTSDAIRQYLTFAFAGESIEKVLMLEFDEKRRFLGTDIVSEGAVNSSSVTPRRLLEVALRSGAKSVCLAHNHPGGTTEPSNEDLYTTEELHKAFRSVGITLLEHYIVANLSVAALSDLGTHELSIQYPLTFHASTSEKRS